MFATRCSTTGHFFALFSYKPQSNQISSHGATPSVWPCSRTCVSVLFFSSKFYSGYTKVTMRNSSFDRDDMGSKPANISSHLDDDACQNFEKPSPCHKIQNVLCSKYTFRRTFLVAHYSTYLTVGSYVLPVYNKKNHSQTRTRTPTY